MVVAFGRNRAWLAPKVKDVARLDAPAASGARTVLTGHGPPWTRGAEEAVEHARGAGRY